MKHVCYTMLSVACLLSNTNYCLDDASIANNYSLHYASIAFLRLYFTLAAAGEASYRGLFGYDQADNCCAHVTRAAAFVALRRAEFLVQGAPAGAAADDDDGLPSVVPLPAAVHYAFVVMEHASKRQPGKVRALAVVELRAVHQNTRLQPYCKQCTGHCWHEGQAANYAAQFLKADLEAFAQRAAVYDADAQDSIMPSASPLHKDSKQAGGLAVNLKDDDRLFMRMLARMKEPREISKVVPYVHGPADCCSCGECWTTAAVEETGTTVTYMAISYMKLGVPLCILRCKKCKLTKEYDDNADGTMRTRGYITELEYLYDTLRECQVKHTLFTAQHEAHRQRYETMCTDDVMNASFSFPSASRLTRIFYRFLELQRIKMGGAYGCCGCSLCGSHPKSVVIDCNTCSLSKYLSHFRERDLTPEVEGATVIEGSRYSEYTLGMPAPLQELFLRAGCAPVAKGKAARKALSVEEQLHLKLELIRLDFSELAMCMTFLANADPKLERDVHKLILREMGSKSPSYLIALAGRAAKSTRKLFTRAGSGDVLSPNDHAKLKKRAPLFGDLLDWIGVRVDGGRRFPAEVGGYLKRLASHAAGYWTKVEARAAPDMTETPSCAPTAEDDLTKGGLVATPGLRGYARTLTGFQFKQDAVNRKDGGGAADAEPLSGFACHRHSIVGTDLTPGVSSSVFFCFC